MDPLSLVANIIAVTNATSSVAKTLKRVIKQHNMSEQMLQLMNEISDFQVIITSLQQTCENLNASSLDIVTMAKKSIQQAKEIVHDLCEIVQTRIILNYTEIENDETLEPRVSRRNWIRERDKVQTLVCKLRDIKQELVANTALITASELPRFRMVFREVSTSTQKLTNEFQEQQNRTNNQLDDLANDLRRFASSTNSNRFELSTSTSSARATSRPSSWTGERPPQRHPAIHVQTSMYRQNCGTLCTCACHQAFRIQSPPILRQLLGSLFVGYSGMPSLLRYACNQKTCVRGSKMIARFSYYFPAWFLQRAIIIRSLYDPTNGHLLSVRTPRSIPSDADVCGVAQSGSIESIHKLFCSGMASPFDVENVYGYSLLHFAIDSCSLDMCEYLLNQSADPEHEDYDGRSCIDSVCSQLLQGDRLSIVQRDGLKRVFGRYFDLNEIIKTYKFTTIHKIVLGFSSVPLVSQLELSTAEIDSQCSRGNTALMWAISHSNIAATTTLLSYGADIYLANTSGLTAFHFAARLEEPDISKLLIERAVASSHFTNQDYMPGIDKSTDITIRHPAVKALSLRTNSQYTPFNNLVATSSKVGVPHARLLLESGADINAQVWHGATPLMIVVWNNKHEILRFLIKMGARADIKTHSLAGLLHYAAWFGNLRTIQILTEEKITGLAADDKNDDGQTPLETFDSHRAIFTPEDTETNRLCREAFVGLLDGIARGWPATDALEVESSRRLDTTYPAANATEDTQIPTEENEQVDDEFFDALSSLEISV